MRFIRRNHQNTNLFSSLEFIEFIIILIFVCLIKKSQQNLNRRPSNSCKSTRDCPLNGKCDYDYTNSDSGLCTCQKGYIIVSDEHNWECLKVATTINDSCINDKQCEIKLSNDAECNQITKRCVCRENTHFIERENACYKSVKIGGHCKFTNNCVGEETICNAGVCICPYNTHSNDNFTLCLRDIYLNEQCNNDNECIPNNSRCHNICRCRVSHVISHDGTQCLKVAGHLYDECSETVQCEQHIPDSVCRKNNDDLIGNCSCKSGFHEIDLKCFVSIELNGLCDTNENCHMNHTDVDCISGRCICRDGHFDTTGYCSTGNKHYFYLNYLILIILYLFK